MPANAHKNDRASKQNYYKSFISGLPEPFNAFDWKFEGFLETLRRLLKCENENADDIDEIDDTFRTSRLVFVPDGFYANVDRRAVVILEIVNSNPITNRKAYGVCTCAWDLDNWYWQLAVLVHYPELSHTVLVQNLLRMDLLVSDVRSDSQWLDAFRQLQEPCYGRWDWSDHHGPQLCPSHLGSARR
jgi:hypothetical protein